MFWITVYLTASTDISRSVKKLNSHSTTGDDDDDDDDDYDDDSDDDDGGGDVTKCSCLSNVMPYTFGVKIPKKNFCTVLEEEGAFEEISF